MRVIFLITPTMFLVAFAVALVVIHWRVVLPSLAGMIAVVWLIEALVLDPVRSIEVCAFVGGVIGLSVTAWSRWRDRRHLHS